MEDFEVNLPDFEKFEEDLEKREIDWRIEDYDKFNYEIIGEKSFLIRDISRSFLNQFECEKELFWALVKGFPKGILPFILGKNEKEEVVFCDLLDNHTLLAGGTGSGKTTFLRTLALSLLHFSHHQYLKLVILDPKSADFKKFKAVSTLASDHDKIVETLTNLHTILRERIKFTRAQNNPSNAQEANRIAYQQQKLSKVMPYIVVIFDEFADFINTCKLNKDTETITKIDALASLGRSVGINLIFSMQAPYAEYLKGAIKNNFGRRICFSVGDFRQENLILGKNSGKNEIETCQLKTGEFILREKGKRSVFTALLSTQKCVENGVKRWCEQNFDYSLESL